MARRSPIAMDESMPLYKFNVLNDTSFTLDDHGIELPDAEAARKHAIQTIGSIIQDELSQDKSQIHLSVMVDGSNGERVANFRSVTTLVYSESPFAESAK
jgi:hypothetical protein